MAHPLEYMKQDSTFDSYDMIELGITGLMCRVWDFAQMKEGAEKEVVLSWHNELYRIRCAVRGALGRDPLQEIRESRKNEDDFSDLGD